ncbi:OmpP1/FadL family transporter [Pedobacter metabolipauper]|uniref:Outer membrane protein transport protein (OMPP1/FadL/TodX) n=1 Tax=Pedobacter metabolipauper TaxID=425513 RepID=A0A4R6SY56_9SPHI|nr:outer membrane protein transport protein [Pedobacter metabolipauper]TDQ10977.1 outer membrane protein transport protein (OMPP1/FadL/TodX) [Pedobacter metabolipauper]
MKKIILSLVAIVAATGTIYAQSYAPDALKFSQSNFGSTSRFKGMAGAQIGVGGDMSSLGANPAGLGLFTKSEFSLTPEFNGMKGDALYLGSSTKSSKNQLNLNNMGIVFYSPALKPKGEDTGKGLISTVFGIGYQRNNDFSANFNYGGTNTVNTIGDYFSDVANNVGLNPNELQRGTVQEKAYQDFIINHDDLGYYSVILPNNLQQKSEVRKGSTSELTAALGLNISNQFYIGASVGLVNIRYSNDSEFTEAGFNSEANSDFNLSLRQYQESTGSGVNGRLGVIFRPVSNFRVGATFQTPSWLFIEDNTSIALNSKILTGPLAFNYTNDPDNYSFSYRLRTPSKSSLGASYVFSGRALVSADVDYVDYASIKFSSDPSYNDSQRIRAENATVRDFYKSAVNYRAGIEFKVTNEFSLRGGYGVNGSAIKGDDDGYFATDIYTGGLGYRFKNYYFDAAYQRLETNNELAPYELNDYSEPVASIKTTRDNVFLTFGIRF